MKSFIYIFKKYIQKINSETKWWVCLFENFEHFRMYMYHAFLFDFLSISFYIIFYEDED